MQVKNKLWKDLLVLLSLSLACTSLLTLLFGIVVEPIFGISFLELSRQSIEQKPALQTLQLLNSLGLFVFPALLFIRMNPDLLQLNLKPTVLNCILCILIYFSVVPMMEGLQWYNEGLSLPENWSGLENWMRQTEASALEITRLLVEMEGPGDFIFNLFLIAIIPAFGEELIFRGIVQKRINQQFNSLHLGVWISAICFSAMHLQFFGFLPRLILGVVFGYLFAYGKNIYLPILAHFLNNSVALVGVYLAGGKWPEETVEEPNSIVFAFSAICTVLLLIVFYRTQKSPAKKSAGLSQ